ncbi:chromatin remodeling complex protein [Lentinula raphanica]|nr:chromatin remodeling complex protein [Lentinula raphanica]
MFQPSQLIVLRAYAARMTFYRLKQFQCEVTGKSGLDYFQALASERSEAETLHSRFSETLKPAILKAVQFQVVGRLDHLVESVFERFKDRYFKGEISINSPSPTRPGHCLNVPRYYGQTPDAMGAEQGAPRPIDIEEPHQIYGDLKTPVKEVNARDDPFLYYYWVLLTDLERDKSDKNKSGKPSDGSEMVGSLMEMQCGRMSRDRLSFSKSILRRFIRDCVDRDAAVASPWTVKPAIAQRYDVISSMNEDTRIIVEAIKKGEHSDKRKKVWEDKDGPLNKKPKKMTAAQEEKAKAAALKRDREAQEKLDQQRLAREEVERIAAEKKKKKPIRHPTEDLDVLKRPVPTSHALPFNHIPGVFESFLMTWNFLVVYGHSAVLSLLQRKEQLGAEGLEDEEYLGVNTDQLSAAMSDTGNNWERVPLRHAEGREGREEEALIGCLKDHATRENFPRMREILIKLLFAPDPLEVSEHHEPSPFSSRDPSLEATPTPQRLSVVSTPRERYRNLPVQDRIAILSFMVNLAISSKAIHQHMESCEEQLTALRKEKIEVNRTKKQYAEEMNILLGEAKEGAVDEDIKMDDPSDVSDVTASDNERLQEDLQQKAQLAHSKQREAARAKQASVKQAMAEHRRLDEEVNRRLEAIERELKKLLGGVRVKPMGKDRLSNRIWWFDGLGLSNLIGSGGAAQYGAGRIFIQGLSEFDLALMMRRTDDEVPVQMRRLEEEGQEGMLGPGSLFRYGRGHRELALKQALGKWWIHISAGIRPRVQAKDLNPLAKLPEARRSARTKVAPDITREAYMLWTNRRAINAT